MTFTVSRHQIWLEGDDDLRGVQEVVSTWETSLILSSKVSFRILRARAAVDFAVSTPLLLLMDVACVWVVIVDSCGPLPS